ncbi:MAG TPA: hypothetical protein VGZ02_05375 [Candidatus Baltobacteraceae bacterium]|jgi:hypothetical protein|nr:hypothetical protein [Candidatus Baltobacteraceae bacterium]
MRKWIFAALLLAVPNAAQAATVDPSLIPDGTYTVQIERVVDSKHIVIKMDNGMESAISTNRVNVSFDRLSANDTVKMSIIKGIVAVFAKQ